ncbi:MAG: acyl--CoA ligase [Spirochaetaceae bacterium]|nr:acyl--CoA ligase [Myxococcales bacterium]MCB9726745.1 acyl--CoA ligase [Spirochaetaceae bacterium]
MSQPPMTFEAAVAALTGPGGPFELVTETVGGHEMPVFKNRFRSLRDVLHHSKQFGDAELAVWDNGVRWTFADHARQVASVAAALRERHGVGPGSRVAILAANAPEWVLTAWATLSLGGVVVAMNGWWQGDEIRYGLGLTEPDLLLADRGRLARLEGDPGVPTFVMEEDFADWLAHAPDAELPDTPIDEDDLAAIMFTSGTTGRPKGAMVSHRNLIAFLMLNFCNGAVGRMTNPPPADAQPASPPVSILSSPLFHVSGFQAGALMGPATGLKSVWTTGRFDPVKIMRLTLEEGVTRWGGITTQLWRLVEHPDFEPGKFKQIRSTGGGGSAFSPDLQRTLREKLPQAAHDFNVGYGSTECAGLCAMATAEMLLAHPDTAGRTLPGNEIAILDDDGKPVPDGVDGNICVRGPNVMLGYWRNPEATAETFFEGGWLRTGDVGQMRDGLLFLASRKRDLIIRGGENIYPLEIENRLDDHPDVAEAAVVGVDHRELGQEVKAFVVPRPGASLDPEAIKAWVAETLAYYKVPTYVEIRTEPLPRNATGKVLKPVLTGEAENTFREE